MSTSSSSSSDFRVSLSERQSLRDTFGFFVGPMPPELFLQTFVPPRATPRPTECGTFATLSAARRVEKERLVQYFVAAASQFLPSFTVRESHAATDATCHLSADVGVYELSAEEMSYPNFMRMELFVTLSSTASSDAFDDQPTSSPDGPYPFEKDGMRPSLSRLEMTRLAGAVLGLQSRTHLFSIAISGSSARLLRWDAAGILVTESFSYAETEWLAEFLWRFDNLSPSARGCDTSLVRVDEAWPEHLAPSHILTTLQDYDRISTGRPRHQHFSVMKIAQLDSSSTEHDFLVSWPPRYDGDPPVGRGTRAYLAYDMSLETLAFVKQYWRPHQDTGKEGDVYTRLSASNVQHLPIFGKGNDVRDHTTKTQLFANPATRGAWGHHTRTITPYRMYRMSLQTIGRPLSTFKSTRELVGAIRDAMKCHDEAFFKAGVLHCDISPDNIMIDINDGSGFLIDWDSCIDVEASKDKPAPRRGTWQFMSANLVSAFYKGDKSQELVDDRESAVWVLLWMVLHHTACKSGLPWDEWVETFNERRSVFGRPDTSSFAKEHYFLTTNPQKDIHLDNNPALTILIARLKKRFRTRYRIPPSEPDDSSPRREAAAPAQARYEKALARLEAEGTFVALLNSALAATDAWPAVDDPALSEPNAIVVPRKRTSEEFHLPDPPPPPPNSSKRRKKNVETELTKQVGTPARATRRKLVVPPSDRVLRPRPGRVPPQPVPTAPTTNTDSAPRPTLRRSSRKRT